MVMEGTKLVGVISERDYARKVILKGHSSKNTQIKEIMTTRVVYAQPDQTVEECMALMTEKRIRHLPILEGGQLLGVISIGDLVKSIIAEQRFIIEQLERYISG
jgi:CBS domain-containing protein